MTIKEFMELCHGIAVDKGWWKKNEAGEPLPRSFRELMALAHSEISEALEIARDPKHSLADLWKEEGTGKPEGFMIELCDLLIRLGDALLGCGVPLDGDFLGRELDSLETFGPMSDCDVDLDENNPAEWLDFLHELLVNGTCSFLDGNMTIAGADFEDVFEFVGRIWSRVDGQVPDSVGELLKKNELFKWTLEAMILWKCSYNSTRAHRHGGKRC